MTLHVMQAEHLDFVAHCGMHGGASVEDAYARADEILEIAQAYYEPVFFVGPSAEKPRYYLGAYLDVTGRAFLTVGTTGFMAASMYRDTRDWLSYMLTVLNVRLLEGYVWVADLQKEYFMRAMGFKRIGIVPDKMDIPGVGSVSALAMYIRQAEFEAVNAQSFRDTLKKSRKHRRNIRAKKQRAAG